MYIIDLGGGFRYFLFSSLFGEDEPILTDIFEMGWNHQLVMVIVMLAMIFLKNTRDVINLDVFFLNSPLNIQ